jgi:AcrR family transcriptional regulator
LCLQVDARYGASPATEVTNAVKQAPAFPHSACSMRKLHKLSKTQQNRIDDMSNEVKTPGRSRSYDAGRRQLAADQTRRGIIEAARALFLARGYTATTMAAIAESAGVALDTVYAAVGPKPVLFRHLVEIAISGLDRPVVAEERDYVRQIQAESSTQRKLELYAGAIRRIQARLAPLFSILREAAPTHPELSALWEEISQRRARNMRLFAADLATTGGLRSDLSAEEVADVIWATNSSEFYLLLVRERGWAPERFEQWLADTWGRLLLTTYPEQ